MSREIIANQKINLRMYESQLYNWKAGYACVVTAGVQYVVNICRKFILLLMILYYQQLNSGIFGFTTVVHLFVSGTVSSLVRKLKQQAREQMEERRPNLVSALNRMGDFYMELKWDFQSWGEHYLCMLINYVNSCLQMWILCKICLNSMCFEILSVTDLFLQKSECAYSYINCGTGCSMT